MHSFDSESICIRCGYMLNWVTSVECYDRQFQFLILGLLWNYETKSFVNMGKI